MLKIKDNVDLKELEKFGFRYHKDLVYKSKKSEWSVVEVGIDPSTKIINIAAIPDLFHTVEDTLYDLITAGLVEKLGKNERLNSKIDESGEHGTYIELKCDYSVNNRNLEKLRNVFRGSDK